MPKTRAFFLSAAMAVLGSTSIAAAIPQLRAITLNDSISVREVHEPRESPDGRLVAYIVKQAVLDCNCTRAALYVIGTSPRSRPKELLENANVSDLAWTPDGKYISYLIPVGGTVQLWRIDPNDGSSEKILSHGLPASGSSFAKVAARPPPSSGILKYRWSHDGKTIAFTVNALASSELDKEAAIKGFLYNDLQMFQWDLRSGNWNSARRQTQVWLFHMDTGKEEKIWDLPPGAFSDVNELEWSHKDLQLALSFTINPKENFDNGSGKSGIGFIDLADRHFREARTILGSATGIAWSPDDLQLAFVARPSLSESTLRLLDVRTGALTNLANGNFEGPVFWDSAGRFVFFESNGLRTHRVNLGLYAVMIASKGVRRVTSLAYNASDCDLSAGSTMACIWQSPTLPPNPALIDNLGRVRILVDVNRQLMPVKLGNVREIYWKNEYGMETNGYLILPAGYKSHTRLPLVILSYAFEGDFTAQASPTTTYPAQAFARDGIAVLLINYPRFTDWPLPDFSRGSLAFGYGPLSSLKTIVHSLAIQGIIDPRRVGFAGHSWGGFWVEFAITHSPELFAAAEIHNGGTSVEPGTYWEWGNIRFRTLEEHLMGGPPYGRALKNYIHFSPTLNADKVRTPVLMEYDDLEASGAFEMFSALRRFHVPVDFFVYPGDAHVFQEPEHRFYSMQRNLDWFEFWLQNREDPDPAKREQYRRWEKFRIQRDALLKKPAL